MKYLTDNRGVALVVAMLMVFVSLAIIVGVLMMITQGVKVSSLTRQYETARAASYGAAEFSALEIMRREIDDAAGGLSTGTAWNRSGTYGGLVTHVTSEQCFNAKLTTSTIQWPVGCNNTLITNLDTSHDYTVTLAGAQSKAPFTVFVKLVDTRQGNTSLSTVAIEPDGGNPALSEQQHVPFIYRIEFLSQRTNNPDERAVLSSVFTW
jgi:hypothetical protein